MLGFLLFCCSEVAFQNIFNLLVSPPETRACLFDTTVGFFYCLSINESNCFCQKLRQTFLFLYSYVVIKTQTTDHLKINSRNWNLLYKFVTCLPLNPIMVATKVYMVCGLEMVFAYIVIFPPFQTYWSNRILRVTCCLLPI
jgi:hypothetical protein